MNRLRRPPRRTLVVAMALLAAMAVLLTAVGARSDAANLRLVTAVTGDVTETLVTSGTIDSATRRDATVTVPGTVARAAVAVGDMVKAGDLLVRLDPSSAQRAVRKAKAALAQAEADQDDAGETQTAVVTAARSSSPSTKDATTTTPSPASAAPSVSGSSMVPAVTLPEVAALTVLQQAVVSAQSAETEARADAVEALDAQTAACGAAYGKGAADADAAVVASANAACDDALVAVQTAQKQAAENQAALDVAIDALTEALVAALTQSKEAVAILQQWVAQQASTPSVGGATSAPSFTKAPATSSASSGSAGSVASVAAASALSVAEAQAKVDSAKADVVEAQQELAATRVVAAIDGTVTALDVNDGDEVSAGDVVATVVGEGGATVTLSLTSTQVRSVAAGQSAKVRVPGGSEAVAGTVTFVSPVASDSGTSFFGRTTSYAAEIHVATDQLAGFVLPQGARAEVSLTVGSSKGVLTVPTSAVTTEAGQATVVVPTEDGSTSVAVEIGRMGAERTEITVGLQAGDEVVLADLDATVDAAGEISTTTQTGGFPRPGGSVGGNVTRRAG